MSYLIILSVCLPVVVADAIITLSQVAGDRLHVPVLISGQLEHTWFAFETTSRNIVVENPPVGEPLPESIHIVTDDTTSYLQLSSRPGFSFIPSLSRGTGGILGVGLGSVFADTVGSMMIRPGPSSQVFQVIVSPTDPREYCSDGSLTRTQAQYSDRLGVMTASISVSLVFTQNSHNPVVPAPTVMQQFIISTSDEPDYIPGEVAYRLAELIDILRGSRSTCSHIMEYLPSIQYTISGTVSIVLDPRDYLTDSCQMRIRASERGQYILGINFLKHVAVLFDFTSHQIGFCDPI